VKILELSVPKLVELGQENVVLDCDYDYDEREKLQLDVKWYFNDSPTPFFQWVPEQMKRPQGGGRNATNLISNRIKVI
jgi:hypothetical protein